MTGENQIPQSELAATFGQRLKFACEAQSWNQSELARQTSLAQTQVSRMEAGLAVPKALILVRLVASLGISTDYLLRLCDDPRWLNYKGQDLMHRSVEQIAPRDRPLVQGVLRVFLHRNL